MAERSSFRKMLDRTKPNNLSVFPESELRDCENYFLEVQSDSTLPPDENITASERLALIRSEIALRHCDAKHRQTQRLARWAIAFGMISLAVAIASAVAQFLVHKPAQETWPATIGAAIVATPTPTGLPIATPELTAAPPTTAPEPTAPPPTITPELTPKPTPRRTPTEQRRKKRRTRPETTKKTDPIRELLRSLSWPKPTPGSGSKSEP
jgi:hypothetical protein